MGTEKIKKGKSSKRSQRKKINFDENSLAFFRQLQKIADRENHLEAFLEAATRIIGQNLGYDRVAVFLFDAKSSELVYLKGWAKAAIDLPSGYRQGIDSGLIGRAARVVKPVVVNDVSKNRDYLKCHEVEIKSEAAFPITFRSQLLGVLDLQDAKKNAFSKGEVNFLNFLTRFLGSALAERRKEEELTSQLEKTRVILDGIRDGYYEVDLKGNFTFINEALARAWGRKREELLGKNYRNFLESESIDRVFKIFNQVYSTGKARGGIEIQVRDIKGTIHTVELSVALKRDASGAPIGFYGIVHDITERVRIENELRAANARFSSLLEALPDVIYFKDLEGRNLIINRAMEEMTGLKREEILGKTDSEIFPPDLAAQCLESDQKVLAEKKIFRFFEKTVNPDGQSRYFETIKAPVFDRAGNITGIVGISRDITEKTLAEEKIKESERNFRSLFENSTLGLYRTTPDGRILLANPTIVRMLGYESFEELSSRNLERDGFEPSYPRKMFIEKVEKEGEVRGVEAAWKRKDGTIIYVRESARAIRDENGRTLYYEGTVEDITEKKLAELALAEQKELFQTVLDSAEDLIFVLDRDYKILLFNKAAERVFSWSLEELKGKKFNEIYPAEGWPEAKNRFDRVLKGEVVKEDVEINFRGRNFVLSVTEVPLRNEKGEVYAVCGIARDVTRRVELERELESSLREKEVLLREIHHRVKNNMQVISSLLNLQAHYVNNPEFTSIIKECQNRIRSMALVHEHLYQSKNLASINFADYLGKLIIHLYNVHQIKQEKVELEIETDDLFLEIGVAIPLGLLASEIISNSFKHAFPGERKGKVRVRLKEISPSHYQLEISDNGVGLPPEVDPVDSKSFGLQLISLLSDQIGGKIEVDRTAGTRFVVSFEYRGSSLNHNS
ncbi:MAG: PAS domain S-box protein [Candidatus Aminicenantes bacterium]|nr:PAS domain S-box protein [Candidatus Aminicenantes bacterium]